jgi:two-component system, chemotaxis family, chemotaxis protein CheY
MIGEITRMLNESRYVLDNINVFIVDDNRHMRSLVTSILHALGVKEIGEAGDAAEAFTELQHFIADVLIVDWHMEPLDGLDFVRLVRTAKDSPNPYVPIIMLSGYTEYRRVTEARDAGVNEFLAKPISARALYMRFASIIEHPRPFVRTKGYFGPDRRRINHGAPRGLKEKRKDELQKAATTEGLSTSEIDTMFASNS